MLNTTLKTPAMPVQPMSGVSKTVFSDNVTLASLRVLVCVAKADGDISPEERLSIGNALMGLELPANVTPKSLFDEKSDLDAQLHLLTTPESRASVYHSALGMVHTDGNCTPAEQKVLEHIRTTLEISDENSSLARGIFDGAKDTVLPSNIEETRDSARRATEVKSDITKYSVLSGVLGAFPVPGLAIATDLAVVGVQVKLVRDIGQRWGHKIDKQAATSLLGGLGLGTGARIAVSNLAKLVPVWGSAVGATGSFASTWALGQIADKYFAGGMKTDTATMKSDFKFAQEEGRTAYATNKDLVDSKRTLNETALQSLGADLKTGKITQQEYSARVEQFA
jgi:uncharacterized protein (DUF697 family)/uncharacterized tellurite resistance protein B-like protein